LITRRKLLRIAAAGSGVVLVRPALLLAASRELVDPQPYFAGVARAIVGMAKVGEPLRASDAEGLAALMRQQDQAAVEAAESILARYTLVHVEIEADGYPRTTAGSAPRTLIEQGWRAFLVRVSNPIGNTLSLDINAGLGVRSETTSLSSHTSAQRPGIASSMALGPRTARGWLTSQMYLAPPLGPALSGLPVEYRVIQLYSRDRGRHREYFSATGPDDGTMQAWLGNTLSRRGVQLDFECNPSRDVVVHMFDADGRGCMGSLTIRDALGRVYPLQGTRLAPDMPFQPHIYRADGETVRLPDGDYAIEGRRGPEYLRNVQTVHIGNGQAEIHIQLRRWIDPSAYGWYSGDTHIHAAGCAHYEDPTHGVSPETIIRHVRGEALSIGEVLTWGAGYYHQKQFFTGHVVSPPAELEHPELQAAVNASLRPRSTALDSESLLRYDVEVSGFPSSHAGHLVLLRLQQQDYPGAQLIDDWPSWNLPILQWAKAQGGVVGYAHCASGMWVDSTALPNYEIPPFDGVGTNEAIIDATFGAVDFLSGCEVMPAIELNSWYHLLNCGFRLAMVGETDFPCISDERPGVGRSYVRLDQRPTNDGGYAAWIDNLKKGRLYFGDGRTHFLEFSVNGRASGDPDVVLQAGGMIEVNGRIAAWLEPTPTAQTEAIRTSPAFTYPGWHLERARLGQTREIEAELVVNGVAVDRARVTADGVPHSVRFATTVSRSSWVALRVLQSGHCHPVFIRVGTQDIRASRRSAQWCRSCVDKIWEAKLPFIREAERAAASRAFDHARQAYDEIIAASDVP
jgi:hypothetical protein